MFGMNTEKQRLGGMYDLYSSLPLLPSVDRWRLSTEWMPAGSGKAAARCRQWMYVHRRTRGNSICIHQSEQLSVPVFYMCIHYQSTLRRCAAWLQPRFVDGRYTSIRLHAVRPRYDHSTTFVTTVRTAG